MFELLVKFNNELASYVYCPAATYLANELNVLDMQPAFCTFIHDSIGYLASADDFIMSIFIKFLCYCVNGNNLLCQGFVESAICQC